MSASREKRLRQQGRDVSSNKKSKTNWTKIGITAFVAVVLVLALVLLFTDTGIPHRSLTAFSMGDESISVAEYNYALGSRVDYYISLYNSYLGTELMRGISLSAQGYGSMNASITSEVNSEIYTLLLLLNEAKARGIELSESNRLYIEDQIAALEANVVANGYGLNAFYREHYGRGANAKVMREYLIKSYIVEQFQTLWSDEQVYTEAQLNEQYEASKDDYDTVSYMVYKIAGEAVEYDEDASDDDKKALNETTATAMKAKGDALLGKITDEASFITAARELMSDEDKEASKDEDFYVNDTLKADISNTDIADWVFGQDARAGDSTVITATNAGDTSVTVDAYVIRFVSRAKQTQVAFANVRAISMGAEVDADATEPTTEQLAAAQERAKAVLAEYEAGAKTDESFAALVEANTDDAATKYTGGLNERVTRNPSSDVEITAWLSDSARKPGDVAVLPIQDSSDTSITTGYAVLYFQSFGDMEQWEALARNDLLNTDYTAFVEGLQEKTAMPKLSFPGSMFVLDF